MTISYTSHYSLSRLLMYANGLWKEERVEKIHLDIDIHTAHSIKVENVLCILLNKTKRMLSGCNRKQNRPKTVDTLSMILLFSEAQKKRKEKRKENIHIDKEK